MLKQIQNVLLLVMVIISVGLFFLKKDYSIVVFFITMLFSTYLLITRKQFKNK